MFTIDCTNWRFTSPVQRTRSEYCWCSSVTCHLFLCLFSNESISEQITVSSTAPLTRFCRIFLFQVFLQHCPLFSLVSILFYRNFPTDSPLVHILSASCAGFTAATCTNPIWFIKTRLQLDYDSKNKMTVRQCIQRIYKTSGLIGFYKGITASYFGISETVIHFVIYEALKAKLVSCKQYCDRKNLWFNVRNFRSNYAKHTRVRVKHPVILLSLWWLVPFLRLSLRVLPIHTK